MSESTTTALIVGGFGFLATIIASITQILVSRAGRTAMRTEIVERVVELKKNTDGMTTELMHLTGRASMAEGKIAGAAAERDRGDDRAAALITEPREVTEAMNGKDVREQINHIEASVSATQDTLAEEPAVRPAIRKQIDKIEDAVQGESAEKKSK